MGDTILSSTLEVSGVALGVRITGVDEPGMAVAVRIARGVTLRTSGVASARWRVAVGVMSVGTLGVDGAHDAMSHAEARLEGMWKGERVGAQLLKREFAHLVRSSSIR